MPRLTIALVLTIFAMGSYVTWQSSVAGHWLFAILFGIAGPVLTLMEWRRLRALNDASAAADGMLMAVYWAMLGLVVAAERFT